MLATGGSPGMSTGAEKLPPGGRTEYWIRPSMHLYSSADPVQTARRQTAIAVPSGATATSAGEFSSPAAERVTGASHVGAAFAAAGSTTSKTSSAATMIPP